MYNHCNVAHLYNKYCLNTNCFISNLTGQYKVYDRFYTIDSMSNAGRVEQGNVSVAQVHPSGLLSILNFKADVKQ